MWKAIALVLAALPAWGGAISSAQAGNWSSTSTWTGGVVPGAGDTVTISHAVVQDVPNLVIGVNGAAPATSYLQSITGGGGTGYTSCSASLSGGTAIGMSSGSVGCAIVDGAVTPFILDRGGYTACPSVTISATGGTGATLPGTISCATAGGTPAIKVGAASAAYLTIAADTYVRGTLVLDSQYAAYGNGLVINPGANLFMDMTQAGGAMYRIENTTYTRSISADCSSQHLAGIGNKGCSIQGYGGATSWEGLAPSSSHWPNGTFKNVYFKMIGDANTIFSNMSNVQTSIDIEDSTFDACGYISVAQQDNPAKSIILSGNSFRNTPRQHPGSGFSGTGLNTVNLYLFITSAKTTGTRSITNNAFDGGWFGNGNSSFVRDFMITGNYFGQDIGPSASYSWASFHDNFWRLAPVGTGGNLSVLAGDISRVYGFLDTPISINPHFFNGVKAGSTTLDAFIGGFSGRNTGDSGEWLIGTNTAGAVYTIQNSLFLCDSTGVGSSEITSVTVSNPTWALLHNTRCGGYGSVGTLDTNETVSTPAGSVTFKGNLTWETAQGSHTSMKIATIAAPGTTDVCTTTSATASNCDYNAGYLTAAVQSPCAGCTNQGRGYGGAWSYTPGYHDVDGENPRFVDATRKVENFDRKYLGKTLSSQWVSGGTYAYGDLASNSDPNVYQGEVFNFRCTNFSGCTGLGGPGIYDTAWRANWEWASLYWLRELTGQQARYTDGAIGCSGCSAIQALNAWVMAGFAVQNPLYWKAGHDGKDIGTVHLPAVRHIPPVAVLP